MPISGSKTLGALPPGYRSGQMMVIRNIATNTDNITIKNGDAFNTSLSGDDYVLAASQSIILIWRGDDGQRPPRWTIAIPR